MRCSASTRALAFALALLCIAGGPPPARAGETASPTTDLEVIPLDEHAFELEAHEAPAGFPDPLETTNRKTLWFDQQLDRFLIDPLVRGYQFIVPPPGRRAVRRFTLNINSVSILINDLLQREWGDACVTTERFAINSTIGLAGLFDPAAALGMERHHSDFGQTLALFGVGSGPYLVLPFFGPSNARDSSGTVVDFFLQPMLYILPFAQLFVYEGSLGLSSGLAARDAYSEGIAALRSSSVDYYSALRNAYYQTRTAEVWDRRAAHREIADDAQAP
ncbi:VacJ family lipoprotein [bacterium]|nr:VacJ family lipoprotein [bacterium]